MTVHPRCRSRPGDAGLIESSPSSQDTTRRETSAWPAGPRPASRLPSPGLRPAAEPPASRRGRRSISPRARGPVPRSSSAGAARPLENRRRSRPNREWPQCQSRDRPPRGRPARKSARPAGGTNARLASRSRSPCSTARAHLLPGKDRKQPGPEAEQEDRQGSSTGPSVTTSLIHAPPPGNGGPQRSHSRDTAPARDDRSRQKTEPAYTVPERESHRRTESIPDSTLASGRSATQRPVLVNNRGGRFGSRARGAALLQRQGKEAR